MGSLVLTIFSTVVLVLSFLFCILFSYRRGLFNTALRFGCFLVGGILSFILVKLLSPVIVSAVLPSLIGSVSEEAAQLLNLPTLQTFLVRLTAGLISPLLFVIIFFLVEKLTFFIYIPLKKKFANNEKLHGIKHDKLYGALLGIALAFVTAITWIMPISGYTYVVGSTVASVGKIELLDLPKTAVQLADDFSASPIAKVDHAICGWLFQSLSSDLSRSVETVTTFAEVAESITGDFSEGKIPTEKLKKLLSSKETSDMAIGLLRDLLPTVLPADDELSATLIDSITNGLEDLLEAQRKLSDEEFQKEIDSLAEIVTVLQNPSDAAVTIVQTILKSQYVSQAIVNQGDAILQELDGEIIELSKSEKEEIEALLEQHANNPKLKDFAEQLFGLK